MRDFTLGLLNLCLTGDKNKYINITNLVSMTCKITVNLFFKGFYSVFPYFIHENDLYHLADLQYPKKARETKVGKVEALNQIYSQFLIDFTLWLLDISTQTLNSSTKP